jgi:hypothetical protein
LTQPNDTLACKASEQKWLAGMPIESGEQFCDERCIERIRARLVASDASTGKTLAFLLMSGSFSPIHTEHVRVLEIARLHAERSGRKVIGGFLSPSSDGYVTAKLGADALSFSQRRTLCELAVQRLDWISVCATQEVSSNRARHAVYEELERGLADVMNGRELEGIEVMGSDAVVRIFGKVLVENQSMSNRSSQSGRKIYWFRRPGAEGMAEKRQIETVIAPGANRLDVKMTLLEPVLWGAPLKEISSSAVRELVLQRDWETLSSNGWLEPAVAGMLQEWIKENPLGSPLGKRT